MNKEEQLHNSDSCTESTANPWHSVADGNLPKKRW